MLFLVRDLSSGKYSRIGRMGCLLFTQCAFNTSACALVRKQQAESTFSPLAFLSSSPFQKKTFWWVWGGGSTPPNVRSDRQIIALGVRLRRLCATRSMITSVYCRAIIEWSNNPEADLLLIVFYLWL
jgi:hypothetical protein